MSLEAIEPAVSGPGVRGHAETPMVERVGLARTPRSHASEAEHVGTMGQKLGLSRIGASARIRFERARELARRLS